MADHTTYDPSQVSITFAGLNLNAGMGEGDFLTIEMASDRYSEKVSVGGEVARAKSNDKRANVKITTMAGGGANALLQSLYESDAVGAFVVADLNGSLVAHATKAWVKKLPTATRGKETSSCEWSITAADMTLAHAAATPL